MHGWTIESCTPCTLRLNCYTLFLVLLLVPNDELLFKTVHDSVISLHEVLVVEKRSLNVVQVNFILKSMEVTTTNNAYAMNIPTPATCMTTEPHNVSHFWYQMVNLFIVASWYIYDVYTRINHYMKSARNCHYARTG